MAVTCAMRCSTHFFHDLGINTEVIPGEAPRKLSITGVIMRLVKRTAHIYALDQGRDASCQECLLQAVMSSQTRRIHSFAASLLGTNQLRLKEKRLTMNNKIAVLRCRWPRDWQDSSQPLKAWLQAEAESRVERAQNRRTRVVQYLSSGTCVCYWRADVPSMGSLPTIRQGSTAILDKHEGAWLGPATVLAQEMGRSQEQHEEAHGT